MSLPPLKYNPGLRGDEELIRSFVVRQVELELILETIRENTDPSNQHLLVVGPRGSGKTTLVRRVAAELRSDPDFKGWYPLVFAEESYMVSSAGELWLEALFHLGEQTQDQRWSGAYEELQKEPDEAQLQDRALAQLMDFADESESRILFIVENLNMLLGEQMRNGADWNLRHTLQNEPRIMLLGTATNRFDEIDNVDKAWFELLATRDLRPLDLEECRTLWEAATDSELAGRRVRAIQILTGGNLRLLRIMAEFAAGKSFRDLMNQLVQLVDSHTEYFKSHLDSLAPSERRIFVALLDIWDPASAKEVAEKTRMSANKASSLLGRLVNRGAVAVLDGEGRKKYYQITERLYNVYYLMRRRSHPASRVKAAVRFMVAFYDDEQLISATVRLATEACRLPADQRQDHHWAYQGLITEAPGLRLSKQIIEETPQDFFETQDISTELQQTVQAILAIGKFAETVSTAEAGEFIAVAISLATAGKHRDAEAAARKATETEPENPWGWYGLGLARFSLSKYSAAEKSFRKSLSLLQGFAIPTPARLAAASWYFLGELLRKRDAELNKIEEAYRKSIELAPDISVVWLSLGDFFYQKLDHHAEAENAYRRAIQCKPETAHAWTQLGQLLHEELGRPEEAEEAFARALEIDPKYTRAWLRLGRVEEQLGQHDKAGESYRKAVDVDPENLDASSALGQSLLDRSLFQEAENVYSRALALNSTSVILWIQFGNLMIEAKRYDEAETAFLRCIEIDNEHVAASWTTLGFIYCQQSRFEEARRAQEKAIEADSTLAAAWANLGAVNHLTSRYEEAIVAFKKAIEIEPQLTSTWEALVEILCDQGRHEAAEIALLKAIGLGDANNRLWPQLFNLYLERGDAPASVVEKIRKYLHEEDVSPQSLGRLTEMIRGAAPPEYLPEAESWIRRAVEMESNSWELAHELCATLGVQGQWPEALERSEMVLSAALDEEFAVHVATDLLTDAAAAGHAKEALRVLTTSTGRPALEALAVGLQIFLGESPKVAQEISEVAQDVAQRIREKSEASRVPVGREEKKDAARPAGGTPAVPVVMWSPEL